MSKRILLCDDELHIVTVAKIKLRGAGYEVVTCHDGEEAWELIQQTRPDLLVTDYCMPRLDGLELCRRIRSDARTQDLPIFMMTGKSFEMSIPEIVDKYGILDIIAKPFSPRDLLQRVNRTLEIQSEPPSLSSVILANG